MTLSGECAACTSLFTADSIVCWLTIDFLQTAKERTQTEVVVQMASVVQPVSCTGKQHSAFWNRMQHQITNTSHFQYQVGQITIAIGFCIVDCFIQPGPAG